MLLRISLILAILLGAGTIFVTQKLARDHFTAIKEARDKNAKDRDTATTRYKKAETTLTATSNKLTQTQATLTKTEEELNGTKQQLAAVQEGLNKTKAELAKAIEERKAALADLAKWDQLGVKPEQVRDMITALQKNKDDIAAMSDEKKILERRATELNNRLQLIIGVDYDPPLPVGTKGNIVAVDPKWNFVVLDLGADKGMLEGGVLMVHRNSQLVGKVRIREVLQNRSSIASPMAGWKLGDVEEGDQVLY